MGRIPTVLLVCLALLAACLPAAAAAEPQVVEPGFDVAARATILLDPESGVILYANNERQRLPPASVTKVMTMLLIMEAVDSGRVRLSDPIEVSAFASGIGGSQVYLKEGEHFPLDKMLIAIAVESANDASTAVAEHLYSTEDDFVRIMNSRARRLGMNDTHFANAHGLPDPNHYMSASDIAVVSRELIEKHPGILKYTSIWTYTFRPGVTELRNTNELIHSYRGADGLKTGHTEDAGWCLVGTAKRGAMRLLAVVLGTESNTSRLRETRRLLDYGFRNFERRVMARAGQELGRVAVPDSWPARVRVRAPQDVVTLVPRGKARVVSYQLTPLPGVRAPIKKGQPLANLEIIQAGRVVGSQHIAAAEPVGRANFLVRGWRSFWAWVRGLFGR